MRGNFIIARHTTTDWNIEGRIQGQTDTELNEVGKKEALALAEKLLPLSISKIVSSDLKRAFQTAQIINQKLNVPLILDRRLRECSFGSLEGLNRSGAFSKYGPEIIRDWEDQYLNYDFLRFGGETREIVLQRHQEVIRSYFSEGATLIVGHGRGLNTLLYQLGIEPNLKRGSYKLIENLK